MLRHQWTGDERPTPGNPEEDDGGAWLVGTMRCMAGVALAVGLATSALSAQLSAGYQELDDGNALGALHAKPAVDEDYWQNPEAPSLWVTPPVQAVTDDGNDLGAMHANPAVDEDFWQNPEDPALWPTPPIQAILDAGNALGALHANPAIDEDYWANPEAPSLWITPPVAALLDTDDVMPTLADDDAGLNPLFEVWVPVPPMAFTADDVLGIAPPSIGTDEDFWVNPNVVWPNLTAAPILDDGNALGGLHAAPSVDEDLWQNPTPPALWPVPPVQAVTDDGNSLGNLSATPAIDEDFWVNPAAPALWLTPPLIASSDDGNDCGALHASPVVDEDAWVSLPAPQLWPTGSLVSWPDDALPAQIGLDDDSAGPTPVPQLWPTAAILLWPDDDLPVSPDDGSVWIVPRPTLWVIPVQVVTDDSNDLGTPPLVDEDYWTNPVAPQLWVLAPVQAITSDEMAAHAPIPGVEYRVIGNPGSRYILVGLPGAFYRVTGTPGPRYSVEDP